MLACVWQNERVAAWAAMYIDLGSVIYTVSALRKVCPWPQDKPDLFTSFNGRMCDLLGGGLHRDSPRGTGEPETSFGAWRRLLLRGEV
jgi:hypothetical protein